MKYSPKWLFFGDKNSSPDHQKILSKTEVLSRCLLISTSVPLTTISQIWKFAARSDTDIFVGEIIGATV